MKRNERKLLRKACHEKDVFDEKDRLNNRTSAKVDSSETKVFKNASKNGEDRSAVLSFFCECEIYFLGYLKGKKC